jgi:hypothetical protein
MATKRFKEKPIRRAIAARADSGDKSEFEDKVNADSGLSKDYFYDKQLEVKVKIEKNEVEEKYAKDYSDILHKEQRDISKLHRDAVLSPRSEQPLAGRIAVLEKAVAQLHHFISANMRPDLSKGALKREPDLIASETAPKGRRKR